MFFQQIRTLQKACRKYDKWKSKQKNPNFKPWLDPEQLMTSLPKLNWADVQVDMPSHHASQENLEDEEIMDEKEVKKFLKNAKLKGDTGSDDDDDEGDEEMADSSGSNSWIHFSN